MKPIPDTDESANQSLEHSSQPIALAQPEAVAAIRQSPAYATTISTLALIGIDVLRKNAKLG